MRSKVWLLVVTAVMALVLHAPAPTRGVFVDFVPSPVIVEAARVVYPASGPNEVASGSATDVSGTP